MDYSDLLLQRRSVRNYEDRPVPLAIIEEIINESILAPSSRNNQGWSFVVVDDKSVMKQISDECKNNFLADIQNDPLHYAKAYEQVMMNEGFNIFYNAPCVIYILAHKDYRDCFVDSALVACYTMFAAASRGLGTCWIHFATAIKSREMLEKLGISDEYEVIAPLIVGHPREIPPAPKRKKPVILKIISE